MTAVRAGGRRGVIIAAPAAQLWAVRTAPHPHT
jgi:hypothetical protein